MLRIRRVWWIPIAICLVVGIVSLIPVNVGEEGSFLPYQSVIPLAPVSSILIWLLGVVFFGVGRWFTDRPIRTPMR